MIKPDAIPVVVLASEAVLSAAHVDVLFGKGYKLRGTEHVAVAGAGGDLRVRVRAGKTSALSLVRLDMRGFTGHAAVSGPKGSLPSIAVDVPPRRLTLPRGLLKPWGLSGGDVVAVQLGAVILTDVAVVEGTEVAVQLDPADLASSGEAERVARLRRDVPADSPAAAPGESGVRRRLITENDVRQARLRGEVIEVHEGQIVTPAARSLGKELGVLR